MGSVTVRLDDGLQASLREEAARRMVPLSVLIRERLQGAVGDEDRLDALERRVGRLEEMAGL